MDTRCMTTGQWRSGFSWITAAPWLPRDTMDVLFKSFQMQSTIVLFSWCFHVICSRISTPGPKQFMSHIYPKTPNDRPWNMLAWAFGFPHPRFGVWSKALAGPIRTISLGLSESKTGAGGGGHPGFWGCQNCIKRSEKSESWKISKSRWCTFNDF